MLVTNIDHWDLFSLTDSIYLLFPRFKNDFGIGMKNLYHHKNGSFYLSLRDNPPSIKNVRLNVIRYFKPLNIKEYRFYPCWVLYCEGEIGYKEIVSVIKYESFLGDIFAKLCNLQIYSTPLVNFYPSKFVEGIRIDRSTIIGKRFNDEVDFCKFFSEKLINSQPSLNFSRCTKMTESVNLGWLNKYVPEDVNNYQRVYDNYNPVLREIYYLG